MQKNKLSIVLVTVFLLSIFSSACKKMHDIEVLQTDDETIINFSEVVKDIPDKQRIYLMDLEVMNRQCTQNCRYWALSANTAKNPLTQNKLVYGKLPPGLIEKVKARPLSAGEYSVDGLLLLKEGEQEIKTVNVRKIFTVE